MATLQCVTETVVLHINAKNYDRLVVKKNPKTHEQLRETTFTHYTDIVSVKLCVCVCVRVCVCACVCVRVCVFKYYIFYIIF